MEDLPRQTRLKKENPDNKDDRFYKADLNVNEHEVRQSSKVIPDGMKKVWIPDLNFWLVVSKKESDQEVIKRTMKKFRYL